MIPVSIRLPAFPQCSSICKAGPTIRCPGVTGSTPPAESLTFYALYNTVFLHLLQLFQQHFFDTLGILRHNLINRISFS